MIILSIGTDRNIFKQGSSARNRMIEYGSLFTELHIIIFSLKKQGFVAEKISDNVWIYPTNSTNRFNYIFDAGRIFREQLSAVKPSVVSTQDPFETGLAGWLIIRKHQNIKFHVQIHTDFMSRYFYKSSRLNRIRVLIARYILPRATAIRAVSERIRSSLQTIDPLLLSRTTVLPIYTDIEKFKHEQTTVDLHKKYPHFSFIILMASRLTVEKNIGFALQSLRDIIQKHKNVGLVIVGEGPEKRYLEGLVLRYHLDRNVVFESWQQNLISYYRTADVFLTTSLYEGYGLTLVEAAAAGCPIITTNVGIAEQLIVEGSTGFICDLKQPSSCIEPLRRMIEDPTLRNDMKKAAEHAAHNHVSEPKEVYLRKYKDMVEQA